MSIAPNVGALSAFMSRRLTGRTYVNLKDRFQNALKKLPSGQDVIAWAKKGEEAFKSFFTPGMLFEAFKFDYQGPVNGHRLDKLLETFSNLDHLSGPVLIHVQTKKGKGFDLAEENPSHFHGVGSFGVYKDQDEDMLKGVTHPTEEEKTPSYTEVFGRSLCKLALGNDKLVTITAAMPEGTGLQDFGTRFPDRFFDVAIAEQHAVTFAAGLALEGFVPVVAIYSTFMQRAYDQIIHDVCLQNLHVILAMDRGGIVGEDGADPPGPAGHVLFALPCPT